MVPLKEHIVHEPSDFRVGLIVQYYERVGNQVPCVEACVVEGVVSQGCGFLQEMAVN